MQRKSRRKAERVIKHTLADGTVREYRYGPYRKEVRKRYGDESLEALIKAFQSSPDWTKYAPATKLKHRVYFRDLHQIGHINVVDIKRRELLSIRDSIASGSGPGAANAFTQVCGILFRWAVKREWIELNPALAMGGIECGELRPWTEQDVVRALSSEALPERFRRVILLAIYTCQRRGDLVSMKWSAYDGDFIHLKQQKTKVELTIPVHPVLRGHLDAWKAEPTVGMTILLGERGRPWSANHLTTALPAAIQKIGLPDDLTVHGLRKFGATRLADASCTVHEIAAITGHRTLAMVQHYTKGADQRRLATAAIVKLETSLQRLQK